ncbi:HipA family kinase [Formosimonas limnophila]|nr:HipA family kinase [Formosimonas limnophila]
MTAPFYCTASDGQKYFVKGLQANRQSQVNEWLCAHLAQSFGLPIPTFCLLYVDETLHVELPPHHQTIGVGYSFGSQERRGIEWLESHQIARLPNNLKRDILVFDKWINNTDRTIGNHNLIFNSSDFELFVIDHNLAFDPEYSVNTFLEMHLFGDQWQYFCNDWVERDSYTHRMKQALKTFDSAWNSLPHEWQWANDEQDLPAQRLSRQHIDAILNHYEKSEFWQSI